MNLRSEFCQVNGSTYLFTGKGVIDTVIQEKQEGLYIDIKLIEIQSTTNLLEKWIWRSYVVLYCSASMTFQLEGGIGATLHEYICSPK